MPHFWLHILCRFLHLAYLFHQESRFAFQALNFTLVGNEQQPAAAWAGFADGSLPGGEIAIRVVVAAVKNSAFAGLANDDLSTVIWTGYPDFFQQGFGVTAGREVGAADEFSIAPPADQASVSFHRTSINPRSCAARS